MERLQRLLVERNLRLRSTCDEGVAGGWQSSVEIVVPDDGSRHKVISSRINRRPGSYDEPAEALCDLIERANLKSAPPRASSIE